MRGPAGTSRCRAPTPSPHDGAAPAPLCPNMSWGGSEVTAAGSSVPFESAQRSHRRRLFPAIRADMAAFAMELPPAGELGPRLPRPALRSGPAGPFGGLRCPARPGPPRGFPGAAGAPVRGVGPGPSPCARRGCGCC